MSQPIRITDEDINFPPLGRERGSGFTYNQLFSGYQGGSVFTYDISTPSDFKQMLDTDGKAAGIEKLLSYPILACPWEITPTKGDVGEAEFIQEHFAATEFNEGMRTPLEDVIAQMTWSFTVRRVYFEKVFKLRESDGRVVYDKLAWRPPETCELALNPRTGEMQGFRQQPAWFGYPAERRIPGKEGWVRIPADRAFVYVHGRWRDPIDGISSMQVPYWCWLTKRKIRYLWYQFLETTSLPKTIVKNADETRARQDARLVSSLRSRDVVALDSATEVDAFESAGKGSAQFIEALKFLDSEMSHSILAGFMDLTSSASSGKGSYALSQDQSTLFLRTRRMVARDMARQLTTQVIGDLVRYNFGRRAACPQFVFGPISEASEEAVLGLFRDVTNVTKAHAMPKEFLDELTLRTASLLELDPDKVGASIRAINDKTDDPLTQLVGGVAAAADMVAAQKAAALALIKTDGEEEQMVKEVTSSGAQ